MKKILLITAALFSLTACPEGDAETEQRRATEKVMAEAERQLGMPDIVNFQERRMAKDMLELRDTSIATFAYVLNPIKGCFMFLGESVGFGLPYSVQYTSPEKVESLQHGITTPQADPNGLYMPAEAAATWVMLYNPKTKKVEPTYIESDVTITTHRLINVECH